MSEEKKTFETKTYDVEGLGEVTRKTNGDFSMSQAALKKFFNDNGLPDYEEIKKRESEAINTLIEKGSKFLGEQVAADHRDCKLKSSIGGTRFTVSVAEHKESRNPSDPSAAPIHHYGVVGFKIQHRIPKKLTEEGGTLDQIAKDIEASFKKIHK